MSEEIRRIGAIWKEILEKGKISLEELKTVISKEHPEILKYFDEIIEKLFVLGFIKYDGEDIALDNTMPDDLVEMPCIRCTKVSTCKVGAKNDPLKCESFVEWFIKKFSEQSL
ncbi:MAG: hypothetical protein NDP13_02305 [Crenarchaeota archaeon]|nr:hypothetical protein [Thermoproteota archaeon]MCR8453803.1 hypothetical protein [Thermoproteota archaeon]MCR8455646.1 hypothetical protein [Thermoproteota archaeon]MCR8462877.1 hypothetical protein [Thermoproteota archaeon]MCR8471380.1 hypothetical protein [Thermoproteota archaeon]